MVLGAVSVIGTVTQVAKGKLGALFLGATGVGVLSQLTLLYGLMFIIAGLGFFNGIMRQISVSIKDASAARAQMNSVALFLGVVSIIITAIGIALSGQISDLLFGDDGERHLLVSIVILAVPIAVQQRIFRAYLNATRDLKGISRAQSFADISSVATFAFFAWFFDIWGAVISFVTMHAILLVAMMIYAVRSGGIGLALPDPRLFRWSEITPNFGYGVVGVLRMGASSLSVIIIGRMIIEAFDLAQAGIFSVAWKVATVYLGAVYAAAGSYYLPTLMRLESVKEIEDNANRAVALYMTILPPMMVGLIVFGDAIIPILFSSEFLPAVIVMSALLLGDVFRVTGETIGLTLLARRHLTSYTAAYLFYLMSFVALGWYLLPQFGLLGIAIAYVALQCLNLLIVQLICHLSFGLGLTWTGLRPFLLALIAITPLTLLQVAGFGIESKAVVATLIALFWLSASWRTDEMTSLRDQLLKRLKRR